MEELRCVGCGITLQCEDESKEGYVHPNAFNREFILCKRCYQIKHYGKFSSSYEVKNTIDMIHKSASKDDLVILVCDIALVYTPLIKVLKELNTFKNLVVVCNRYDLYKDYINKDKALVFIKKEIKKFKLNIKDVFIIDNNINEVFDYIDSHSLNKNAYLVGLENAGKTTLVNNILKEVAHEEKEFLTNSRYPGTTIDLIKIPLDEKHYLIDSPGIHSKGNLLSYVENDFIKKLQPDNKIKPIIFQINPYQSLLISNIIKFDYLGTDRTSIVFYGSSQLEIIRCKYENANKTFNNRLKDLHLKTSNVNVVSDLSKTSISITDDKKHDIVIEGLGFFTVRKGKYEIFTLKGGNVFVRDSFI